MATTPADAGSSPPSPPNTNAATAKMAKANGIMASAEKTSANNKTIDRGIKPTRLFIALVTILRLSRLTPILALE
jgi:hypothetical protein